MRNLLTVLFLLGFLFSGFSYGEVCFADSGISFKGHGDASVCEAPLHVSSGRLISAEQCGECIDIELSESKETQTAQSGAQQGRQIPAPELLAVLFHVLQLPVPAAAVQEYGAELAQAHRHSEHLSPLATVVLRM